MSMTLRPVQVFRITPDSSARNGYSLQPAGEAAFHCWGNEYVEFEAGPGNSTVAVVEFPNGKVETFHPSHIQFMDRGAQ